MPNILTSIKLLFCKKDRKLYADLYAVLGFYPRNIRFYQQALAHASRMEKNEEGERIDNERLEFLGDAIIEAVVSDILFHRFDKKREGFLTTARSKVVRRETLNKLAVKMKIFKMVHVAGSRAMYSHTSVTGNAFEALMGAIYLDKGFEACKWFMRNRVFAEYLDLDELVYTETNFKSRLLEWCQKRHVRINFQTTEEESENSKSTYFKTLVYMSGMLMGEGRGSSKKHSHQAASSNVQMRMKKDSNRVKAVLKVAQQEMEAGETRTETPVAEGSA